MSRLKKNSYFRTVTRHGDGFHSPAVGSACTILINQLTERVLPPSLISYLLESDMQITIGCGYLYVDKVIDSCVSRMKLGEICEMACLVAGDTYRLTSDVCRVTLNGITDEKDKYVAAADNAEGSSVCKQSFVTTVSEENQSVNLEMLKFRIELKHFDGVPHLCDMTGAEILKLAEKHKNLGVNFYKCNDFILAMKCFSRTLKLLLSVNESEHSKEMSRLKCQCYLNIAACQCKVKSYKFVIQNCTKALIIESNNIKGLYRRAEAYMCTQEYDKAAKDIENCIELEPHNKAAESLSRKILTMKKNLNTECAKAMHKMFS